MLCLQLLAHGEGHRGLVEGLVSGDRHLNLVSDSQQEQAALGLAQRHLSDDLVEALTKELLAHGADSGLAGLALHNLLVQVLTQTSHVNTRGLLVANILDEVLAIFDPLAGWQDRIQDIVAAGLGSLEWGKGSLLGYSIKRLGKSVSKIENLHPNDFLKGSLTSMPGCTYTHIAF